MPSQGSIRRVTNCTGKVLLALLTVLWAAPPAHADITSAFSDYKKGDYPRAFQEYLALARLGQPLAQFDVATLYSAGRGTPASDIDAYAWATLAAANGEPRGKKLADEIRPKLAPGAEATADSVTLPYTDAALQRTLLPDYSDGPPVTALDPASACYRTAVHMYVGSYPDAARRAHVQGTVVVEFTLMPDGIPRFPRIVQAVPAGLFEGVVKASLLRSQFSRVSAGSAPVECTMPYNFIFTKATQDTIRDFETELGYKRSLQDIAQEGDPEAQLVYGLLLSGLPLQPKHGPHDWRTEIGINGLSWLVKAAQAGIPLAQYAVAHSLLDGRGCRRDEIKGLKWLQMAAEQGEPNADITLATRLLRGTPSAADVTQAKEWLERGAAQSGEDGIPNGSEDAQLLLATILAATPQASLRDPSRARDLLKKLHDVPEDPTPFEIQAAAQAAQGDFSDAVRSEQAAISRAGQLGWDLSPLEQRLALYESSKPWYGSLLEF